MQNPKDNPRWRAMSDSQIAGLMAQTGCLMLAAVIASVLAGIWLDRTLQTRPLFTLLLVLGGSPIMLFVQYRLAKNAVAKAQEGLPAASKETHVDDDE
jgi:F0F1-type ATP synthase assembly protein I